MANLFSSLEVGSDVYIPRYRLKEYQQENEAASRKLCDASLGVGHNTVETALDLGGKPLYFLLDQGKTALHFACTRNDVESVETFLSIYVKESVGKEGEENALRDALMCRSEGSQETPLLAAADSGSVDVVALLLTKKGVDVAAVNGYGSSCLHCALRATHNAMATVEQLLRGIEPSALPGLLRSANNRGVSLVAHALFAEPEDQAVALVKRLAAAGSAVDHADREGMTALHHAAIMRSAALVEALLSLGADKTMKDDQGRTPAAIFKAMTPPDHTMTSEDLRLAALF